jgi:hypothetical protein
MTVLKRGYPRWAWSPSITCPSARGLRERKRDRYLTAADTQALLAARDTSSSQIAAAAVALQKPDSSEGC